MKLSGWGRFPVVDTDESRPDSEAALARAVAKGAVIARGNGRAYGDSAIGLATTLNMRRFNRMIAFDPDTGQLVAEAGLLLSDVIDTFLPRGWFPMVTPGTKFVTLGGMIAADVHGKNHHRDGAMRASVDWIDLMGPDGQVHRCSRDANAEFFDWTVGGMGLTGVILRAAIRLRPVESAWIRQRMIPAPDLDAAMAAFEDHHDATYSVAWIDCLSTGAAKGRALVMLGEHARAVELPHQHRLHPLRTPEKTTKTIPIDFPGLALNPLTVRAFNAAYYRNGLRQAGTSYVDWDSYFYPLDAILGWNRIYGRRGFVQFQCVLPLQVANTGLHALLDEIAAARAGCFLSVLKRFGPGQGRFSFPMEGYTLALDFPVNRRTLALMSRLDAITLAHGGRFYLAKDARLSAKTLRAADPRAEDFAALRQARGMSPAFRSSQSERLSL
ncbi:putative oxidoreductase [Rhodovulum sp. P5]|uniref:FAD-binding oxidoreductase n=1 Tax=Rhodovulum sp. P5 TaxID=1564506 RepID=UPI0009C3BE6E|nr:FAD-binding oxidoreductase [Rhodovulum sp. P5]ARE40844.1 putative oxidoreductase [Rhodovulum sp. P5]